MRSEESLQEKLLPKCTASISFLFVGVLGDRTVPKEPGPQEVTAWTSAPPYQSSVGARSDTLP